MRCAQGRGRASLGVFLELSARTPQHQDLSIEWLPISPQIPAHPWRGLEKSGIGSRSEVLAHPGP